MRLEAHFKCAHDQYAAHPLNPDLPVLADGVNLCRGGVSRPVSINYEAAHRVLVEHGIRTAGTVDSGLAHTIVDAAFVGFHPQPEGDER